MSTHHSKIEISRSFCILLLGLSLLPSAINAGGFVPDSVTLWTEANPKNEIHICWMDIDDPGGSTQRWDDEKALVETAVENSWVAVSGLKVHWTDSCPADGSREFVRILITERPFGPDSNKEGPGSNVRGLGMAALRPPTDSPSLYDGTRSWWFGFPPNGLASWKDSWRDEVIYRLAHHEFGHIIGLDHEQNRPENADQSLCTQKVNTVPGTTYGPYDGNSVMNYCSRGRITLTDHDIDAVRAIYGWPGRAVDIGVGSDIERPWVIGTSGRVFRWNGQNWQIMRAGKHIAIDVGPDGNAWVVSSDYQIFQYRQTGVWTRIDGEALDIGVGANGRICVVGISENLFCRSQGRWTKVRDGAHIAVDVGPGSQIWAVETDYDIVALTGNAGWTPVSGSALDVGVGFDGSVYVVGNSTRGIFRRTGNTWSRQTNGESNRVSGGPRGTFGFIDPDSRIFIDSPRKPWPGRAIDIGVGPDANRPWVIGNTGRVFRWNDQQWQLMRSGVHRAIDVDHAGFAWIVESDYDIYRFDGRFWRKVPGKARDIGIGANGKVCVVGVSKRIFCRNGTAWDLVRSADEHTSVDVAPDGTVWVTEADNKAYFGDKGSWDLAGTGKLTNVGVAANGEVFGVGALTRTVFRWSGDAWRPANGVITKRVSGGPNGEMAIIDKDLRIFLHQ